MKVLLIVIYVNFEMYVIMSGNESTSGGNRE